MLTVPVSAVDPKDNGAASAFQHSLQDLAFSLAARTLVLPLLQVG